MANPSAIPGPGTDDQKRAAAAFALMAGSGGPKAVSAPADQPVIVFFDNNGQLVSGPNPAFDENAPPSTIYGSQQGGYFTLGRDGKAKVVMNPNPDYLVTTAVQRQNEEALRNEKQANANAGKGYMTNDDALKWDQYARTSGLSQDTLNQQKYEFERTQRNKDALDAANADKIRQDIATGKAQTDLIGAQTQGQQATTQSTLTQTQIAAAKAGPDIEQTQALTDYQRAQAEDVRRKAGLPTISSTEGPTITYTDPRTGEIKEQARQGFVPKTSADIAARSAQIAQAMQAKSDELYRKIGPNYSAEQANADLQQWHSQVVAPQQQVLNAASQDLAFSQGKDIAEAQRAAAATAQGMGTLAINAYNAQAPRMVGEGAAEGINKMLNQSNKAMGRPDVDYSWMVTKQPNLQGQVNNAVQQGMQQFGPQQLAAIGAMNNPQAIQAGLDMTPYLPGNRPPGYAPMGPTPTPQPGQFPPSATTPFQQFPPGGGIQIPQIPQLNSPQATQNAQLAAAAGMPTPPTPTQINPWANNPQQAVPGGSPPAGPPPVPTAPGNGYDPSNIQQWPSTPGSGYDPTALWGANRGQPLPGPSPFRYPVSNWAPPAGIQGLDVNGLNVNGLDVNGLNLNSPNPADARPAPGRSPYAPTVTFNPWNWLRQQSGNMGIGFNPQIGPGVG